MTNDKLQITKQIINTKFKFGSLTLKTGDLKKIGKIVYKKLKRFTYYIQIWWVMSKNSFIAWLNQGKLLFLFLVGKLIRFILFLIFLYFILKGANTLVGYNTQQVIFFFLTFNLIDILAQFLFRSVYSFKSLLISGDFDLILVKPLNALFRALMGGADIIDLITIPPLIIAIIYMARFFQPSLMEIFLYIFLIANGLLIAAAFHIATLSIGIVTMEIDNTIQIYRDLTNLGRFPIEVYKQPLRGILTYLIPVGIMISFPAKVLMGIFSPVGVLISLGVGYLCISLSLIIWKKSLKSYSSASS